MGKIFTNFNYFVWTPLGSIVNIYINFCLQVHFEVSAAWYCSHYLPPVIDNGGKFSAGVVNTGGKLPPVSLTPVSATLAKLVAKLAAGSRCRWYRWCTLTCEYLLEFSKKFELVLMGYSGAGGKLIYEKNQKQKISLHCPFKAAVSQNFSSECLPLISVPGSWICDVIKTLYFLSDVVILLFLFCLRLYFVRWSLFFGLFPSKRPRKLSTKRVGDRGRSLYEYFPFRNTWELYTTSQSPASTVKSQIKPIYEHWLSSEQCQC